MTGVEIGGQGGIGLTVKAARLDNCWDGIQMSRRHNFLVSGVYSTHNHDDFVENDNFASGTIEDYLVDGCTASTPCVRATRAGCRRPLLLNRRSSFRTPSCE
jgi:hypothetical protein